MKEKKLILEEILQILENQNARTYLQTIRITRIKISLGECLREIGQVDKAKYLLGTFLFKLRIGEEKKNDQTRYLLFFFIIIYDFCLLFLLMYVDS